MDLAIGTAPVPIDGSVRGRDVGVRLPTEKPSTAPDNPTGMLCCSGSAAQLLDEPLSPGPVNAALGLLGDGRGASLVLRIDATRFMPLVGDAASADDTSKTAEWTRGSMRTRSLRVLPSVDVPPAASVSSVAGRATW